MLLGSDAMKKLKKAHVLVCGVGGVLFMGAKDMIDPVSIFVKLIIDGQNRTARVAENSFGAVAAERFDNYGCSCFFHC